MKCIGTRTVVVNGIEHEVVTSVFDANVDRVATMRKVSEESRALRDEMVRRCEAGDPSDSARDWLYSEMNLLMEKNSVYILPSNARFVSDDEAEIFSDLFKHARSEFENSVVTVSMEILEIPAPAPRYTLEDAFAEFMKTVIETDMPVDDIANSIRSRYNSQLGKGVNPLPLGSSGSSL